MNRAVPHFSKTCPLAAFVLQLGLCVAIALAGTWGAEPCQAHEAAVRLVICSHGEAQEIWLDAHGNPIHPAQSSACAKCPDCLAAGAAVAAGGRTPMPSLPVTLSETLQRISPVQIASLPVAAPIARGPPRVA